jgi:type III pantothenate kinase
VNLLLDIGNTRVKWGLEDAGVLSGFGSAEHGGAPATALPALTMQAVTVAQVFGPAFEPQLAPAIEARYGVAPRFVRTAAEQLGLANSYAEPQRLGVDRWLMMLALWRAHGCGFCVAGAGTALTLDGVGDDGRHLGGFIAAGLATHLNATLGATRFATHDLGSEFGAGLGQDTESCVRQGALLACLGAIDRGWQAAGSPALRVIAGGDAARLLPLLGEGWVHRPHLVLEGLAVVANAR